MQGIHAALNRHPKPTHTPPFAALKNRAASDRHDEILIINIKNKFPKLYISGTH